MVTVAHANPRRHWTWYNWTWHNGDIGWSAGFVLNVEEEEEEEEEEQQQQQQQQQQKQQ